NGSPVRFFAEIIDLNSVSVCVEGLLVKLLSPPPQATRVDTLSSKRGVREVEVLRSNLFLAISIFRVMCEANFYVSLSFL
ncbi:MAG: hypothetical protein V3U78_06555, partial [Thiotrichaceae bacterium]